VDAYAECGCPSIVNATQLFQGEVVAAATVKELNLSPEPSGETVAANFSGNIGRFGTNVFQINCSFMSSQAIEADVSAIAKHTTAVNAQLVVNPSFEVDLLSTPSLVGSFESFGQWRQGGHDHSVSTGQIAGDSNPLMPSIEMPVDTPFGAPQPLYST